MTTGSDRLLTIDERREVFAEEREYQLALARLVEAERDLTNLERRIRKDLQRRRREQLKW